MHRPRVLLAVAALLLVLAVAPPARAQGNPDTSGDGVLSPIDLLRVINHINGQPDEYEPRLDVNADGRVDARDAQLLNTLLAARITAAESRLVVAGVYMIETMTVRLTLALALRASLS